MDTLFGSVFANLLTEFIVIVAGLVFVQTIRRGWKIYRFGRWQVRLVDDKGLTILERPVSTRKAEEILGDEADLNVYLKGLISPFGNVKVDLVTELEAKNDKVITKDETNRRFTIHLQTPFIIPNAKVTDGSAPSVENPPVPGAVL